MTFIKVRLVPVELIKLYKIVNSIKKMNQHERDVTGKEMKGHIGKVVRC